MHRQPRLCRSWAADGPARNDALASLNLLTEIDPTIKTDVEARFVDDGGLLTSAGVFAGIDMALHLVDRLAGVERAREVRRGIQYDPHPPV